MRRDDFFGLLGPQMTTLFLGRYSLCIWRLTCLTSGRSWDTGRHEISSAAHRWLSCLCGNAASART